jgi:N-acetylglucosamine transport system substrate-binding protein
MKKKASMLAMMVIIMIILQSLILTSCSWKTESASDNQTNTSYDTARNTDGSVNTTEISGDFEVQIFEGGYGSKAWKDALDGFKKENPKVNLIIHMGPKVNEQMHTRWISNNPPDFVYVDGPGFPADQFRLDGKFADLTGWFNKAKNKGSDILIKDKIIPYLINLDEKIYGAPILFNCWGLWYDETLFKNNEITPPSNFDELLKLSEQLKLKNIAAMGYAGLYPEYLLYGIFMPGVASEGGEKLLNDVVSAKNPEVYRSVPFKKIISKIKYFADKGYIQKGTTGLNHTQSQMEWLNRKVALIPNGLWLENEMKQNIPADFKMNYIPSVFQDKDKKMTVIPNGATVAIASKAKNPKAAMAFLEYLYRDEVMKNFTEETGIPSAIKLDLSAANVSQVTKNVLKKISNPDVQFVRLKENWSIVVEKAVKDVLSSIVLGRVSVDEACERIYKAALNNKE